MEREDEAGGHDDASPSTRPVGFPEFEHGQYTFEGEIERLGAFARGAGQVRGWRRSAAVFIALLFLLPVAASVTFLITRAWPSHTRSGLPTDPFATLTSLPAKPLATVAIRADRVVLVAGHQYLARIVTNYGTIAVHLDTDHAPIAANHFALLAEQGAYNNLTFHRVVTNFVIQGGDPNGNGTGLGSTAVLGEVPVDHYPIGSIAAAKRASDPAGLFGIQFFIVTGDAELAMPNIYARFGTVIAGLDVAQRIEHLVPRHSVDFDGPPSHRVAITSITISQAE